MKYTIQVTVETCADNVQEAYSNIRFALNAAKKAEIIHLDSEVLEQIPEFLDDGYDGKFEDSFQVDPRD